MRLIFYSIIGLFCLPTMLWATDQVSFRELAACNSEKEVLLYGAIQGSFTDNINKNLDNGIAIYCSFFVQIYKQSSNWPEELVHETEFRHSIKYDSLKQNYIVQLEKSLPLRITTKKDAQERFEHLNDVPIAPLSLLVPEQDYLIKIKAKLEQESPKLGVNTILPFITALNKKTKWYSIKIRY